MHVIEWYIPIAGLAGAILKEILADNALVLPKFINGKIDLGFIGGALIGAAAGYAIDGGILTAAMGGFTGRAVIEGLLTSTAATQKKSTESIEDIIRRVAQSHSIDPELAVRVAKCESNLKPDAVNVNTDGSVDRGIFQINSKYHHEVKDSEAFDPEFSAEFFCKAFANGNLSWWNSSRTCWDK